MLSMTNPWIVVLILVAFGISVIISYVMYPSTCPTEIHTKPDGQILLMPTGKSFENIDEFQRWWKKSEFKKSCPLPTKTGKGGRNVDTSVLPPEKEKETTYATTPINKVDDYEFTRIFGTEENGRMVLGKEDYNRILFDRTQDWVNKPYSSEERQQIAARLPTTEGFTGEVPKNVMDMVLKEYSSETEYEPVVTQIGENWWEVSELKPTSKTQTQTQTQRQPTMDIDAHSSFALRSSQDVSSAVDPYFSGLSSEPGMERMFGPTFDTKNWA